jgi:hypothetical protein
MRREMMQKWADYLEELKGNEEKANGKVLTLQKPKNTKEVISV